MRFIGFYNYTVILTYMSLISGLIGMILAHSDKMMLAMGCLLFSGICDLFDGPVARMKKNRTEDQRNFGIQIDSLCDLICFGVFPAVLLYCNGIDTPWGIGILIFYVLCAVIRLSFFNILETRRQKSETGCAKAYRGLPVTSAAIIFPAAYVLSLFIPENATTVLFYILPALTGLLFIWDFRVPKMDVSKIFRSKKKEEHSPAGAEQQMAETH